MKKHIVSNLLALLVALTGVVAQELAAPPASQGKGAQQARPKPAKPVSTEPAKPRPAKKKKGPSEEKVRHAEERSKGNAFSGKGEGGEKNRMEPADKLNGKKQDKLHEHKKGDADHGHEGHGHDHKD